MLRVNPYTWPFPPPGGPIPWTPEQVREHERRHPPEPPEPAPW